MTLVSAEEGYRIWADRYDESPNPLTALEDRVVRSAPALKAELTNRVVLDAATGTGRWLKYALRRGADAYGIDSSPEMLAVGARDRSLAGRLIRGDLRAIPLGSGSIDIAMCSFALGYLEWPGPALAELARVAARVIVSDLHPEAIAAGWTRSFRSGGTRYEIAHFAHSPQGLDRAMEQAGFRREWFVEASFGRQEEAIFEAAGKGADFPALSRIPAIFAASWKRACD